MILFLTILFITVFLIGFVFGLICCVISEVKREIEIKEEKRCLSCGKTKPKCGFYKTLWLCNDCDKSRNVIVYKPKTNSKGKKK